jgi:hypothetical protein
VYKKRQWAFFIAVIYRDWSWENSPSSPPHHTNTHTSGVEPFWTTELGFDDVEKSFYICWIRTHDFQPVKYLLYWLSYTVSLVSGTMARQQAGRLGNLRSIPGRYEMVFFFSIALWSTQLLIQ